MAQQVGGGENLDAVDSAVPLGLDFESVKAVVVLMLIVFAAQAVDYSIALKIDSFAVLKLDNSKEVMVGGGGVVVDRWLEHIEIVEIAAVGSYVHVVGNKDEEESFEVAS